MTSELELDDIQGLIAFGHGHLQAASFLFLRQREGGTTQALKTWISSLLNEIVTAKPRRNAKPNQAVHLAITAGGLTALGLPKSELDTFLQEFQDGMAHPERARILGDLDGSAPERWDYGAPPHAIHFALLLYADTQAALEALRTRQRAGASAGGLVEVACQELHLDEENREPFGFRDGIAQPAVQGLPGRKDNRQGEVKAGEFVLGYPNAYGEQPFSPSVPEASDPSNLLSPSSQLGRKDLGRNGTYLVIRKLEQDVKGFWGFVRERSGDSEGAQRLAAKLMGRWTSGAPLALAPDKDDPALGVDAKRNNAFLYAHDPDGLRCPMGSHIRRTNPRDVLSTNAPADALKISGLHRLIRRGRPYQGADSGKQGIVFVAINANIGRQFEFVQQTWLNNPKFNGLYSTRDPIAGANLEKDSTEAPETYTMSIPEEPVRLRLTGLPRFVHTRGGDYFFLPGLRALRYLAQP